ncbi:MAG: adenylyl-sulfate reductase [Gammaproteobacteria bacterium]|nr:adenylyl-sulfate reductase [Gammaproteobacteria bacterium]
MFTSNPFAELSAYIPNAVTETFIVVMFALVVVGTLFDVIHKKSAKYFFEDWQKSKTKGTNQVGGGQVMSMAVQTLASEVLTSSEFCSARRRIAHLLTMYGFVGYIVATTVMVFCYSTSDGPAIWPMMWHIGALMVCVGGYWFWFFIRADVSAEGNAIFSVSQADLFVLSLLASTTWALVWSWLGTSIIGWVAFGLYVFSTAVLFGSIPWSKFAHMFFKPSAALQKRVAEAAGSRSNLPAPADKPETLGSARGAPTNY